MPRLPPFANPQRWRRRASHSKRVNDTVWYDPDDRFEYHPDPNPGKKTWHRIDPRKDEYQEIDPDTGLPVSGSEGRWRPLR